MTIRVDIQNLSIKLHRGELIWMTQLIVPEGTILGILGANGSGKTTLLKGIGGLIDPSTGCRLVNGSIGWKSAQLPMYCPFWVEEVVALHPSQQPPQYVHFDPISQFDLGHLMHRPLATLSTGEQHRCFLARLFCRHYDILILDEPLTGLDPHQQFQLGNALSEYRESGGTVILASHSPDWVQSICTATYAIIDARLRPMNLNQMTQAEIRQIYTGRSVTNRPD